MSVLIAMFSFSLAMSITPGPVNMIILSSAINYGFKKTMPYVAGANIGFLLLLLAVGFVLEQFIQVYPIFLNYLAIGGSLYIIYMGYKIATSKTTIEIKDINIPKFYQGFLLQWLNPKAWIAAVSGVSIFASADSYGPLLIFITIYFFVCYASLLIWAFVGDKVSVLLNNPARLRIVNIAMGLLLIVTAVYLCYSHLS
jgi:threonine/homoserine/homoserine lactone efflux protein